MDTISKNLFETFEKAGNGVEEKPQNNDNQKKEPMKVVLRVKPFTDKDLKSKEHRECILLKENGKVEIKAPQDSFQFKSSIRGLTDQTHEFSFSKVFDDTTQQKELFDDIMLPFVKDILDGQNGLVFTYGVTNSGKTYTIQGTPKDGGILPRALDVVFNSISKKLYTRPNLKPKHHQDVVSLTQEEEEAEELLRRAVFNATDKENVNMTKLLNSTTKSGNSTASSTISTMLSDISMIQTSKQSLIDDAEIAEEMKARIVDSTTIDIEKQGNVKFGVWVSFMEIYNEMIYDLLDLTPIGKGRKRAPLKLGEDKNGKPYVKGLKTVFVTSSNEAYKILRLGQNNRHMAATKLNQQSSRSHCIFNIKLLKIFDAGQPHVSRISRLSIVDLAGSERYCKTGAEGDLLKQAGNINASIMTLGKCISTLRYNQEHPNHQTIIPFRESKLTRLFQNFFLGKGKASMIVNISQCASVFDETYHVLKFSAIAKQIKMKAERATLLWKAPPLPKLPATPANKRPPLTIVTPATSRKRTLDNPADFSYNELVNLVSELRDKVKKERIEKANLETTIRKEVGEELNELMTEIEESHSTELISQRECLEELMENRIELLTKVANKCKKINDEETAQVTVTLEAEKMKVKERDDLILTLRSRIRELEAVQNFLKISQSPQGQSKQLHLLSEDLNQTKETLLMQNEGIERMQNMLQNKDDEIDKLREALDEIDESPNDLIKELQELLETTTKELDVARVKLDNRDVRIKELESIIESQKGDSSELVKIAEQTKEWYSLQLEKNKLLESTNASLQERITELENSVKVAEKNLSEKKVSLKETEEMYTTAQFENDELSIKLEKYESVIKEHQTALTDNESFIEQLNAEVMELKSKLKEYEEKDEIPQKVLVVSEDKDESVKLKEDLEKAETKVKEYGEKIERLEKQVQCFDGLQDRTPAGKLKSMSKQGTDFPLSPFKGQTPVKNLNLTPKGSPYSPMGKGNAQTIKNLQKLLEETSKALEKKTSLVVQKTNRVQLLESQVVSLEKKTGVKEMRAQTTELQSKIASLEIELNTAGQKKIEFEFKLVNQEENALVMKSEIEDLNKKCGDLEKKLSCALTENEFSEKRHKNEMRHHCVLLNQATEKSETSSKKIDELGHQVDNAEKMIEELTKTLDFVKSEEFKGKEEIVNLRSQLALKTEELKVVELKLTESSSTVESLMRDKERVNENTTQLQKQLEDRRKSRLYVNNQLSSTVEGYEKRIKDLHEQVDDLEEEKCMYKEKTIQLSNELDALQAECQRVPIEVEQLKSKEHEFLERIRTLEESCSKLEIQLQITNTKNTKLEMKITAMESLSDTTSNKLAAFEKENQELTSKVKDVSEMLKEVSKEKLDLEEVKFKIEKENENRFKTILSLEKQKAESDAILASYKENLIDIDSMKEKVSQLEKTLKKKEEEVARYKSEVEVYTNESSSVSDTHKENIELKASLKLTEQELKRAVDEKKFALDELLKQTVKNKRKITTEKSLGDQGEHDTNDPDFITPKRKKEVKNPSFRRLTRSTRKTCIPKHPIDEEIDITKEFPQVRVKDEPNSESTASKSPVACLNEDVEGEEEYVCSVSIALSPLAPFVEEEIKKEKVEEDEEQDKTETVDVEVGQYVAITELESYNTLPIIGKVTDVKRSYLTLEMMRGGYSKQWKTDVTDSGDVVTMEVHRSKILWNHVKFTNSRRLPIDTKRQLQKFYLDI